jgi:hypothetical protein
MLLLLGCSSVKELNSTDSSLIQSSRIGIFRDGGTIQIKLESINEEPMELFIDRRIGTRRSNPELYNALRESAMAPLEPLRSKPHLPKPSPTILKKREKIGLLTNSSSFRMPTKL